MMDALRARAGGFLGAASLPRHLRRRATSHNPRHRRAMRPNAKRAKKIDEAGFAAASSRDATNDASPARSFWKPGSSSRYRFAIERGLAVHWCRRARRRPERARRANRERLLLESARATAKWMAFLARDDAASGAVSGEPGTTSRKARNEAKRAMAKANMSEDAALQAASEFVGEAFVFAVAGGAVWWEVEKSNAKDEKRREDAANERAQLCDIIDTQHRTMVDMSALIEELFEYKKSSSETIAAMQAGRRAAAR